MFSSDAFKAETVNAVAENKGNISQTAFNLGISIQTLHNWVKKASQGVLKEHSTYSPEVINMQEEIKQLKKDLKCTEIDLFPKN